MNVAALTQIVELAQQVAAERDAKKKNAPRELAKAILHVELSKEQIRRYSSHRDMIRSVGTAIRGLEPREAVGLLSVVTLLVKAREEGMIMPELRITAHERLEGSALDREALALAEAFARDSVNLNKLKRLGARITASRDHAEILTHLATFYPRQGIPQQAVKSFTQRLPLLELESLKNLYALALVFLQAKQAGWHLLEAEPVPEIQSLYTIRRPDEVWGFLQAHPELVSLLQEAYSRVQVYFSDSEVALEVITDPEAPDDRQIVAFIHTTLLPEQALERLNRFDEEWWLGAIDRASGKLCIHLEYR